MAYNADSDTPTYSVSDPVAQNSTSANPAYDQAKQQIVNAYQTYLGRTPSDAEVQGHLQSSLYPNENYNKQGFTEGQVGYISESPEAMQYRAHQSQALETPDKPAQSPPPAATGSPVTATGGIPPPAPAAPPATPAKNGATPDELRYVKPVDLSSAPAYQKTQFTSQPLPDQSGLNNQQSSLMSAILTNPGTMSPTVLAQMQEAQKEQALLMAQQNQQGINSSAVGRGVLGGGFAQAQTDANRQAAINAVLTGNRNLDVQAATQNRQDQLNALGASSSLAQDQQNRALAANNQSLATQSAQASENQYANNDSLNRLLQQFGINQGVASNAQGNFSADVANSLGLNSQQLDMLRYLEGQREFNDNLGFNYNQLDQNGQQSLLNYLMSIGAS